MFAEIDNGIGFRSLGVCTPYTMTFCEEDVIVGCRRDDVSQLEVRDEGAGRGADPLELEEVVCVGRRRYVLDLLDRVGVKGSILITLRTSFRHCGSLSLSKSSRASRTAERLVFRASQLMPW